MERTPVAWDPPVASPPAERNLPRQAAAGPLETMGAAWGSVTEHGLTGRPAGLRQVRTVIDPVTAEG